MVESDCLHILNWRGIYPCDLSQKWPLPQALSKECFHACFKWPNITLYLGITCRPPNGTLIEIVKHVYGEKVTDEEGFEAFDYNSTLQVTCGDGSDGNDTGNYHIICKEYGWKGQMPTCKRKDIWYFKALHTNLNGNIQKWQQILIKAINKQVVIYVFVHFT